MLHLGVMLAALLSAASCSLEKAKRAGSNSVEEAPEGKLEEIFWSNGQLLQRGLVVDGKYEGIVEQWWEDGTRHSRKKYRHSVLVDTMLSWHGNGQLGEMTVLEEGNPVCTWNWSFSGVLRFQSIRVRDSTFHDSRWDEKGQLIEDKMKVYPRVRLEQYPPKNGKMDE